MCVEPERAASFAELYAAHCRDVYRFALYLSGDTALAQDITSEVFLRVWMSAGPSRASSVKSWLLVITRNIYLHELRHIRRRKPLDERMAAVQSLEANTAAKQEFAQVSQAV